MYEDVFRALNEKGVRYLVAGGVAVVLHGFLRATADLDLMVDFERVNISAFIEVLKALGYKPRPPVPIEELGSAESREKWKSEKGMRVFSLFNPEQPQDIIDVFVDEPVSFAQAYVGREQVSLGEISVSVVSVPDLIRLKKIAGREQDMEDIRALNELGDGHE